MSLPGQITPDRVRAGAARLRERLDDVPVDVRPLAEAGLGVLESEADTVARVGRDVLAEGLDAVQLGLGGGGGLSEARQRFLRYHASHEERQDARRASREAATAAQREHEDRLERMADGFLDLLGALVRAAGPVAATLVRESLR